MDPKKKLELKSLLQDLEGKRARHTELITVYVPAGYDINNIIQQISQEQGTASNIKSTGTRKNVETALEKMVRKLKTYQRTPPKGLALFSGNVSEADGRDDFQVWAIEPPEAVNVKIYRCDQTFFLDPLREMTQHQKIYGLVVIDRQEGNVALLKGTLITPIYNEESFVPGKTHAGGQSAARYARVREGMAKDFYKKIGALATTAFRNEKELAGVIIGGPGPTKEEFINGSFIGQDIKDKVIAVKDVGYTGPQGIQELVEKSKDVLAKEEIIEEKDAVNHFLEVLNKRPTHAAYGKEQILRAIEFGAINVLLISEQIDSHEAEDLADKVEKIGGTWQIISTETREGEQLAAIGGLAATLRFPIE